MVVSWKVTKIMFCSKCPLFSNLVTFDPKLDTLVSADASSYGLGAVLLQCQPGGELHETGCVHFKIYDHHRAKISSDRKKSLGTYLAMWALLIGLKFHIHIDHKPLVPLFSTKQLEELPLRVQRFCLRMLRYNFTISHIPGKDLVVAYMLSRVPVSVPSSFFFFFFFFM